MVPCFLTKYNFLSESDVVVYLSHMVYVLFLCASMNFAYQPCEVHACHQTNSPQFKYSRLQFWMSIHRFPWRYRSIIRTYCKYVHVMYMYMICDLVLHKYAHSLFICAEY